MNCMRLMKKRHSMSNLFHHNWNKYCPPTIVILLFFHPWTWTLLLLLLLLWITTSLATALTTLLTACKISQVPMMYIFSSVQYMSSQYIIAYVSSVLQRSCHKIVQTKRAVFFDQQQRFGCKGNAIKLNNVCMSQLGQHFSFLTKILQIIFVFLGSMKIFW